MATHKIYNWNELASIGIDAEFGLNDNYILMNDLDSSTTGYETHASSDANGGSGWDSVAPNRRNTFGGSFDGQNYTISDIVIN
ncbi:MAG: hypothetical protein ACOCRK_07585, partial [bacterium]